MPFPVPTLVAQSTSAVYAPFKDLFLYLKGKKREVEDLNDKLIALTTVVVSLHSQKQIIDGKLQPLSKEKSAEYEILEKNMEQIFIKFIKFLTKSKLISSNDLPLSPDKLDVSKAISIIEILSKKPLNYILTGDFFKLAKISRDSDKLEKRASKVLTQLQKHDNMILEKEFGEVVFEGKHDEYDDDVNPGVREKVDEIMRYLSDENVDRIGIMGKVGVGKTIVMKKLYNQLIHTRSITLSSGNILRLDYVIMIDFLKNHHVKEEMLKTIQDQIMLHLNINDHGSIDKNAARISASLWQKKYAVVLIDDVSPVIDLEEVGLKQDNKYLKLVMASHNKKVITKMTTKQVEILKLSDKDSWKLFENICGEIPKGRFRDIADNIIKNCEGLPLGIALIAKYLKGKWDEDLWNGVNQNLHGDVEDVNSLGLAGISNIYKLCYENLGSNSIKKCLLFAALFPIHHKIHKDYLIECWMAERFIDIDADHRLKRTRNQGQVVLNDLTEQFLLEYCSDIKYVKMPQYFRRVAVNFKYPEEANSVTWVPALDTMNPSEETWRTVTRMSLIYCTSRLPECPECNNNYTLLLQRKPDLEELSDGFFLHMKNLQLLDLHFTQIKQLPNSISMLISLRSLYLNDCFQLAMLPPEISNLIKLELLDICGTSITSLPEEIRCLINLRCLRASFSHTKCNHNSKGKMVEVIIPQNIISNLTLLEELTINTKCCISNADELADEMAGLKNLTKLCFSFPSMNSFNRFVSHSKSLANTRTDPLHSFRSFKIFIDCPERHDHYGSAIVSDVSATRQLRVSTTEEFSLDSQLVKQANALELIGNDKVEDLRVPNSDELQVCRIKACSRLRNIGSTIDDKGDEIVEESASGVLQNLKELHLYDLEFLQCIWEGPILNRSLFRLTVLTLNGCPKLTQIFDVKLARTLSSLEHLKVENCCEIVEILEVPQRPNGADEENLSDILNNVKCVELSDLPQLQSICRSNTSNMKWNSLKDMVIIKCMKLTNLSLSLSNAQNLGTIKCEKRWWTSLELANGVKQHLHPKCRFSEEHGDDDDETRLNNGCSVDQEDTRINDNFPTYSSGHGDNQIQSKDKQQMIDHEITKLHALKDEDLRLRTSKAMHNGQSSNIIAPTCLQQADGNQQHEHLLDINPVK